MVLSISYTVNLFGYTILGKIYPILLIFMSIKHWGSSKVKKMFELESYFMSQADLILLGRLNLLPQSPE